VEVVQTLDADEETTAILISALQMLRLETALDPILVAYDTRSI
jgi:hypothetical protein